jgi:hypothetical protein
MAQLKIATSFENAVKALLNTPPPAEPIKGSRAKPLKRKAKRKAAKPKR